MIRIRETLDAQAPSLDLAADRAQRLVALKDSIISQTANLAEAIETLELAVDLDHQVQQAVAAFGKMRHAMVEILAFEPGIQRALVILEARSPPWAILRHISSDELRDVRSPGSRSTQEELRRPRPQAAMCSPAKRRPGRSGAETTGKRNNPPAPLANDPQPVASSKVRLGRLLNRSAGPGSDNFRR